MIYIFADNSIILWIVSVTLIAVAYCFDAIKYKRKYQSALECAHSWERDYLNMEKTAIIWEKKHADKVKGHEYFRNQYFKEQENLKEEKLKVDYLKLDCRRLIEDEKELQSKFDQAIRERDFYAAQNNELRDSHVKETAQMTRVLIKQQLKWIMHYKGNPLLVQAVKSLTNLNTNLWGGRTPKEWPKEWVLTNVLLQVSPSYDLSMSEAWGVLDRRGQALDFIKTNPPEWKKHD